MGHLLLKATVVQSSNRASPSARRSVREGNALAFVQVQKKVRYVAAQTGITAGRREGALQCRSAFGFDDAYVHDGQALSECSNVS